jgi:HEAT repeat protein
MAGILLLLSCALVAPPQDPPLKLPQPPGADAASLRQKLYTKDDPREQSRAAMQLVQGNSAEEVALLTFQLTQWHRPDVFQALAGAIRLRRDVRYLQPMLDALRADQAVIREEAIKTLASFSATAVHDPLLKVAEDRQRPDFCRQAATEALGRVAAKQCVGSLIQLLRSDSPAVSKTAAQALAEISGEEYGADTNLWSKWWQAYIQDMTEADWQASRVRFFNDKVRRLQSELDVADTMLLQLHKELLEKVNPTDLVNYLNTLVDKNKTYPAVRTLAIGKIADLLGRKELDPAGRATLIDVLMKLSEDANASVRDKAVRAMDKADSPVVYRRLLALLRDHSATVRAAAARSLGSYRGKIPPPDTVDRTLSELELTLQDESSTVVANAATSIGALALPRSGDLLARLLKHPMPEVRLACSAALEGIASCRVYRQIMAAVDDASPDARLYLVGCLGRIGESDGLPEREQTALIRKLEHVMLHDGDPGVRSKAATAVGKVGGANELTLLWQRVRANEDARVQDNAWKAVVEILVRTQSWAIVDQWQQQLALQTQPERRLALLERIRTVWATLEDTRPMLELVNVVYINAALVQRQWRLARPVCAELIRGAVKEKDKGDRLNLLLQICTQAVDEGKGAEVLPTIQEFEGALTGFKDLAVAFDQLRRRITTAPPASGTK